MNKCVFFDRDGIVNREPQGTRYIESPDEIVLNDGFVKALKHVLKAEYMAVVITNQKCVSTGIITEEELAAIHQRIIRLLAEHDLGVTAIYYCPHGDDECNCRKPLPGMLTQAADDHGIDLTASWMIGDQGRDIVAGQAVGCRTIYVGDDETVHSDYRVQDISELDSLVARLIQLG